MKKLILVGLAVLLVFSVSGCGVVSDNVIMDLHGNTTNKHGVLIAGVVEDNKNRLTHREPACRLKAAPGQTITLGGVELFECYGDAPQLAAVESYVSPGYELARDLTQMAIFPITGAWMFSDLMSKVGAVVAPYERGTVDPFVPPTVNPFVPPVVRP